MLEPILLPAKKKPIGFFIEGSPESGFTKSSANVVKNADGSWLVPQQEFLRIPLGSGPAPIGENMEITMRYIIQSNPLTNQAFYLLGKWRTIAGDGELDIKRTIGGLLSLDIGTISESAEQPTSTALPIQAETEIYWQRQGTRMLCKVNGNIAYDTTVAAQRVRPIDWVIGGYLNSGNSVQVSARGTILVKYLKINRI